ncbi:uncharacterized protein LOC135074092 [Ostrinia nubilalis]|uniref:uncharacterized protein LOC135074092 n=1 Tax=Ostrinia nubilalis TaxID=29057 RepID=UPI00308269C6
MLGKAVMFFVAIATVSAGIANKYLTDTEMPPNCVGKSYCFEKSEKYPQKLIDRIIEEIDPPVVEGGGGMSIAERGDENPNHGCERKIDFEPIYEILDNDGKLRFVVQSDRFIQKIRTESCVNPGRVTGPDFPYFDEYLLNAWNISCVEKRMDYSFLTLSLDGNGLEDVDIQGGLPVCCSCQLNPLSYF